MAGVAGAIVRLKIKPKTPFKTGVLRGSVGSHSRVLANGNIEMVFQATAPYALFLEDPVRAARIVNFTTPGTRAPFLLPGVREGIKAYLKGAIGVGGVPGVPGIGMLGDP